VNSKTEKVGLAAPGRPATAIVVQRFEWLGIFPKFVVDTNGRVVAVGREWAESQ
jgi:hypothetical protein